MAKRGADDQLTKDDIERDGRDSDGEDVRLEPYSTTEARADTVARAARGAIGPCGRQKVRDLP